MKAKDYLRVSEKFYSLQGEGHYVGFPSIFLRLGGCNLLCKSETWVCDTIEVWQKSEKIHFCDIFTHMEIELFRNGTHLVITGGEPMLHQRDLSAFIQWFKAVYDFYPFIEVETNGTILIDQRFGQFVARWNVSPKLSNSGEPLKRRFKKSILMSYWDEPKSIFKFVISSQKDVDEIIRDFDFIRLGQKVFFMPALDNRKGLVRIYRIVAQLALDYMCRFSPRLHIEIWNKKTGV